MAHIVIYPSSIGVDGSTLHISGVARCSDGGDEFSWDASVAWTALQSAVNTAIQNAAVSAANNLGHSVGALDNKIILAGAAGL